MFNYAVIPIKFLHENFLVAHVEVGIFSVLQCRKVNKDL